MALYYISIYSWSRFRYDHATRMTHWFSGLGQKTNRYSNVERQATYLTLLRVVPVKQIKKQRKCSENSRACHWALSRLPHTAFKKNSLTSFAIFKLLLPSARPRSLVCTPTSDPEAVVSNPTEVKIFHVLCLVPIIPGLTKANAQS